MTLEWVRTNRKQMFMWLLLWTAHIYLQTLFGGSQVFGTVKAHLLVLANDIGPIFLGSAEINLELLDTWCWQRQRKRQRRPPVGSWDLLKGNYCWHPHPALLLPPPSHRSLLTPPPCSWQFLAGEINKSLQSQQFSSFGKYWFVSKYPSKKMSCLDRA